MSENINPPQVAGTFTASSGVGAISASNSTFDGTVRITGGANITVGTDAQGVTISGAPGGAETQTAISGISASDTVYTSGTVKFTGSNAATVKTGAGQAVIVDVPIVTTAAQSSETGSLVPLGNTSGTTNSLPFYQNIALAGGDNITLSGSSGSNSTRVSIIGASGGTGGGIAAAAGTGGNTSGTMATITAGTVGIAGSQNITISQGSGAASTNLWISAPQTTTQSSESGSLSLSGNTAGTPAALPFFSNVALAGGNNITLSQASGANSTRVTISGANVGGAQTGISGVSASDTVYTSGTIKVTGSNMVTVKSGANQAVVIDATQSVQPAQTGISSIAASNTTYTSGQVEFSGSNAATVKSSANQRVIIDVPVQSTQPAQTGISGISASDTVYTSGTAKITGSNMITVKSGTGQAVIIDATQSSQPAQTGISSIAASNTTYTSGSVQFTGSNMITVKSSANQRVVIDATQSVQPAQTGISSIAGSNTTYTSGQVELTGSNIVTVKSSANQRLVIDASTSQSVQPVGSLGVSSNTSGTTASLPFASNIMLQAGDNITISQSSGANSSILRIKGAAGDADTGSAVPAGNTMGTTASLPLSGLIGIAGGNNITLSQSTGAASTNISIHGGAGAAGVAISASDAEFTSGTAKFTGSNIVTVKTGTGQAVIIDASTTQSVQPGVQHLVASDRTFSSGTVSITGTGGGVTINTAASKIQVSVAAPVAQTAQTGISSIVGSDATYTSGSVQFTGSNMVTVKSSANQRLVFDATQSVQPGVQRIVASDASFSSGTVTISGAGDITVNTAAGKIQVSGQQTTQPVGSLNIASNTVGTSASLPFSGNIALQGGDNVTLSQSSGANSSIIKISAGGGAVTGSIAPAGNTTGTTASLPVAGMIGIAGGNNVTVSQSTGAASTNLSLSIPNTTRFPALAQWENIDQGDVSVISHLSAISKTPLYFPAIVAGNLTPNKVGFRLSHVGTGTDQSYSVHFGVYSLVNATSGSLMGSGSNAFIYSTGSSASWSGMRDIALDGVSTVAGISSLAPGRYVFGVMFSAGATGSMHASLAGQVLSTAGQPIGVIHAGTNSYSTATSQGLNPLFGQGIATVNALPANVAASDIQNQGSAVAPILPYLFIRS